MPRCFDCGHAVKSVFDHVDTDCLSEAYTQGYEDYKANHGLFAGMRRQKDPELYIRGWHDADEERSAACDVPG